MPDTLLQVSSVKDDMWNSSQPVDNNRQLMDISYKITLNSRTAVRLVIPVYSPGDYSSVAREEALLTDTDWQNINIITRPQDGVNANRNGLPLGVYDLNVTDSRLTEIEFQMELKNDITPYNGTAKAICKLQYSTKSGGRTKWIDLADPVTILIVKNVVPPAVVKFTATRVVVASDETTMLQWEAVNTASLTINDGKKNLGIPDTNFKGEFKTDGLSNDTEFILTVKNEAGSSVSTSILVKVNKNSAFVPEKQYLFDGQKLMGLYKWGEKLYALVLYDKDVNEKNVLFWESFDGLNWKKTNIYSKAPGFNTTSYNVTAVDNHPTAAINIQTDYAGSPGVVYNNKLYLIGGSRFDSDFRSRKVYYFDFGSPEDGWQQDIDAGFTPRMGHACIVYNGEIWVIGGYGDQGANNEVWKFDGAKWSKVSANPAFALKSNRCMLSALINSDGNIQIYGGFGDFPGNPDQTLANSYILKDTWRPVQLSEGTENLNYVCCSAVQTRGRSFLFNTIYNNKLTDRIQLLIENNTVTLKDILNPTDFGISEYIFNIQAADFKDVVWVCILNKMNTIKSNVLSYFVYVPLNQSI